MFAKANAKECNRGGTTKDILLNGIKRYSWS